MIRKCKVCGHEGPTSSFPPFKKNKKTYYLHRCKACVSQDKSARRSKRAEQYRELKKESKCSRCGNDDWRVLDWHHRDPDQKSFSIGDHIGSYGIERIKQEVEKCDCLCANCHRIVEHEKRNEN